MKTTLSLRRRAARVAALACAGALVLTGCEANVYSLPLPGGTDTGEDPMQITVRFADVLDLVPHSSVKVNEVSVGRVTDIELDGYTAVVDVEMRSSVDLPDNAVAKIRQTSLLGEKFVSLEPPESGASQNPLENGDTIPLSRSGRNPEVEEVLGALSLVLNGGGVAQLKTIQQELGEALQGREGAARSVLRQIRDMMAQLDRNKGDIINAIESLNRLALSVEKQLPTIDAALRELPSALDSINRQRDDLIKMLRALNNLSDVAVGVIRDSKASTIRSLELLSPVLSQLAASGDNFVKAFHAFLTYPFVDEVVGRDPQVARNLHMGDYTNLSVTMDIALDGSDGSLNLPGTGDDVVGETLTALEKCLKKRDLAQCQADLGISTESLEELGPQLGINGSQSGESGGLDDLTGLGRAAYEEKQRRGPTYGDLVEHHDPAMVRLLVPGMVTQ